MWFWRRKKKNCAERAEDWEVQSGCHIFSYKELSVATRGFSDKEMLGKGGFGNVYRGVLPNSNSNTNTYIAVKKISQNSKQGKVEFIAEIKIIGTLQHPNLVRVLGYCRDKEELLLVYEYMPNASLDKLLYSPHVSLSWNQRFKIIKDVASALTFLHDGLEIAIIHRDIKASNVLLDSELNAKLSDFGLAKCSKLPQDRRHVVGTLGYIAPELARTSKANTMTDVYAFGVFCLEVVCGRRPVQRQASPEEVIMVDWVYGCWKEGKIMSTVDSKLYESFKAEEVELVLKIGMLCSQSIVENRPKMSQVMLYLQGRDSVPENFGTGFQAQEVEGESEGHAISKYSTPSQVITESLIFVGR